MNLFADYIHPLTFWLQEHPSWALIITFLVALAESLAIVGSLVPGSVTMTAIGILAGSGIMRIDLTLLASSLGAISGDSLSYALGYVYSDRLIYMWPFKKYPKWINYGKDFFARHGGKSVLIGRFVGPLRSIIPVIAGIMHMKQWRFLISNIISGVGWSLLYVMPGVLIGAAGHELSTESATRLFIIILLLLIALWLVSLVIKWSILKLHHFLKNNLHDFWRRFKEHPQLKAIYDLFTPKEELNHYPTAGLLLATLFSLLGSVTLFALSIEGEYIKNLDVPVYLFLQSFHSNLFEAIFIVCTQLTSTITLAALYTSCCIWLIYKKNIRTALYMSLLVITSSCLSVILAQLAHAPRSQGLVMPSFGTPCPGANLLVATALYGFIFYYLKNKFSLLANTLSSFMLIILGLSGLGAVYLGDHWITDVLSAYFTGAFICLIICLFYRKQHLPDEKNSQSIIVLILLLLTITSSSLMSIYLNYKTLVYTHTPYHKEYALDNSVWWDQQKPILPLYRLNRVGKRTSLLNIQYSGDLAQIKRSLEQYGWKTHNETFIKKILQRINSTSNEVKLPLLTQLYENRHPVLVMVYKDKKTNAVFQLTLWQSSFNLPPHNRTLWIGTLYPSPIADHSYTPTTNTLSYLLPALNQFTLRRVTLSPELIKDTLYPNEPYILLIKNK